MSDLISRQAVEDLLDEYMSRLRIHIGTPNDTESYSYARGLLVGVINDIKQLPSAQPERKIGKWLHDKDDVLLSGYCSCCGWESIIMETDVADMPYCPNCGSYNGGRDDEQID